MSDTIFIHELKVLTLIGILPHERVCKQTLNIDLDLSVDLSRAMSTDALDDTLNYAQVAELVTRFCQHTSFQLLEALAGGLLNALFSNFPIISAIKLTIQKPGALHETRQVGLTVFRTRTA